MVSGSMFNTLLAILIGVTGLGLAWWNHRRLRIVRHRLDFAQTASRSIATLGIGGMALFLAYVVMFPPNGNPMFGTGKVLMNDDTNGRMGKYKEK